MLNHKITKNTILFDLKAAFDSVPHKNIIQSLVNTDKISNDAVSLVKLLYREQRITIGKGTSIPIRRGVIQGGRISPMLFKHCYKDALRKTLPLWRMVLYADDLSVAAKRDELANAMVNI